jgi:hypothetical protein
MTNELYSRERIVNHVENNSPSKFMFSFGKASRFPKLSRMTYSDKFYDLPSTRMNRTTTLGFGTKYDFTKINKGTEFLYLKRDSDKGNYIGPQYSFGLSREKFKRVVCPGINIIDLNIPGPGKYNIRKKIGENTPKYSIGEKLKLFSFLNKNNHNPGPANYSPKTNLNKEGKYILSRLRNIKSSSFGLDKEKRFVKTNNNVPGPGSYNIKGLIGNNFISKYKSGIFITISQRFKKRLIEHNYPGPGSYMSFSEFGILTPITRKNKSNIQRSNKDKENKKKIVRIKILNK